MNVLVINSGSSSLKYKLIDSKTQEVYAKGNCERIGLPNGIFGHMEKGHPKTTDYVDMPTHKEAVELVLGLFADGDVKVDGIGHRVVQGGWYFGDSALVDEEVLNKIDEVSPLAPLHNPSEAKVIRICMETYPDLPNVAVFDTAFHFDMPAVAQTYALPRDVVEQYHIRKYGAHGTSHRYIWKKCREFTNGKTSKLVSCHIGSGSSLCAIKDGKCMDTTMGLTPLDGLVMGTRCGSIDPATVCYLQREAGMTYQEVDEMMNKKSGLLGISGISSDARDIEEGAAQGDPRCELALDAYCYRAALLISQMACAMGGVDTIAFSAGVGENSPVIRCEICKRLKWMGVDFNSEKNAFRATKVHSISTLNSPVEVLVVPTDEEYMIALDVERLVSGKQA